MTSNITTCAGTNGKTIALIYSISHVFIHVVIPLVQFFMQLLECQLQPFFLSVCKEICIKIGSKDVFFFFQLSGPIAK